MSNKNVVVQTPEQDTPVAPVVQTPEQNTATTTPEPFSQKDEDLTKDVVEPVVEPVAEVANKTETSVDELITPAYSFDLTPECLDLIAQVKATNDTVAIIAIDEVLEYIDAMGINKTMDSVQGANNQVKLFSAVKAIINSATADSFQITFATLLRLFDEMQNGPMHGAYLFRFTEDVRLNTDDRKSFNNVMNMLTFTGPVEGRAEAVKQINFQKTLEFTFTEEGRRRVLNFFNV
jgi:hypothetical protein